VWFFTVAAAETAVITAEFGVFIFVVVIVVFW
jgi:hypothetical protein